MVRPHRQISIVAVCRGPAMPEIYDIDDLFEQPVFLESLNGGCRGNLSGRHKKLGRAIRMKLPSTDLRPSSPISVDSPETGIHVIKLYHDHRVDQCDMDLTVHVAVKQQDGEDDHALMSRVAQTLLDATRWKRTLWQKKIGLKIPSLHLTVIEDAMTDSWLRSFGAHGAFDAELHRVVVVRSVDTRCDWGGLSLANAILKHELCVAGFEGGVIMQAIEQGVVVPMQPWHRANMARPKRGVRKEPDATVSLCPRNKTADVHLSHRWSTERLETARSDPVWFKATMRAIFGSALVDMAPLSAFLSVDDVAPHFEEWVREAFPPMDGAGLRMVLMCVPSAKQDPQRVARVRLYLDSHWCMVDGALTPAAGAPSSLTFIEVFADGLARLVPDCDGKNAGIGDAGPWFPVSSALLHAVGFARVAPGTGHAIPPGELTMEQAMGWIQRVTPGTIGLQRSTRLRQWMNAIRGMGRTLTGTVMTFPEPALGTALATWLTGFCKASMSEAAMRRYLQADTDMAAWLAARQSRQRVMVKPAAVCDVLQHQGAFLAGPGFPL